MTAPRELSVFAAVAGTAAGWAVHVSVLHRRHSRDPLTGVLAPDAWRHRAERILRGHPRTASIVVLDLDGFKQINDQHGHLAGDEVLAIIGRRLRAALPSTAAAGRLGGDEFAIISPVALAGEDLRRLHIALTTSIRLDTGMRLVPGASLGLARCADQPGPPSLEPLLRAADAAMYERKRRRTREDTGGSVPSPVTDPPAPTPAPGAGMHNSRWRAGQRVRSGSGSRTSHSSNLLPESR